MARWHEVAMVPEHSSFSGDKSAKWVTLFIGTECDFKVEALLKKVQSIAGTACTVERVEDDPRFESNIYKFFYMVRNPTYTGETVAERLRKEIETMEMLVLRMRKLHKPQEWLEEAQSVGKDT